MAKKNWQIQKSADILKPDPTPQQETESDKAALAKQKKTIEDIELENKRLCDRLQTMENIAEEEFAKLRKNWAFYENFRLGDQWNADYLRNITEYNSDGKPIITFYLDKSYRMDQMPRRVVNEVFPQIESALALYKSMNPTIRVKPIFDGAKEKARRRNIFNAYLFDKVLPVELLRALLANETFGGGYLKIKINKVAAGEIPFEIANIQTVLCSGDPNADKFEKIRWFINRIVMYGYEAKQIYPDILLGRENEYKPVELKEYWCLNEDRWEQYVLYKDQVLLRNDANEGADYPVLPFEFFQTYIRSKGWFGESTVKLTMEYQTQINKRASQLDYHIGMRTDPPLDIEDGAYADTKDFPPRAGTLMTRKSGYGGAKPLQVDAVDTGVYYSSIEDARNNIATITGVTRMLQGENDKGVYSYKHMAGLKESAYQRINLKQFWIVNALKRLANKVYRLSEEYLAGDGYFELFDAENNETIRLTREDFDDKNLDIIVETADADMLSPTLKVDIIKDLAQYVQGIDTRFLIRAIDKSMHGLFDNQYLEMIDSSINADYQKSLNPQPAPPPPGQPPQEGETAAPPQETAQMSMPPVEPPAPAAEAGSDPVRQIMELAASQLTAGGIPTQQAMLMIDQAAQELMASGIDPLADQKAYYDALLDKATKMR